MTSKILLKTRKAIAAASISALLAVGLISMSAAPANAAACEVASGLGEGNGSVDTPFLISTPAQLQRLMLELNNGTLAHIGAYFELTTNLDFQGCTFTPNSEAMAFSGNFDGGNWTISNLVISGSGSRGLFSVVAGALLQNLVMDNITVTGSGSFSHVGALLGRATNLAAVPTRLSNVTVKNSTVIGNGPLGGIAGTLEDGSGDSLFQLAVLNTSIRAISVMDTDQNNEPMQVEMRPKPVGGKVQLSVG